MLPDRDHAGGFQCGEAVAMVIGAKEFEVLRLDADVVGAPLRDRFDHVGGPAAVGKVETLALQSERGKFLEPMFATCAAVMIACRSEAFGASAAVIRRKRHVAHRVQPGRGHQDFRD